MVITIQPRKLSLNPKGMAFQYCSISINTRDEKKFMSLRVIGMTAERSITVAYIQDRLLLNING